MTWHGTAWHDMDRLWDPWGKATLPSPDASAADPNRQLGWRRPRKALPALIPCLPGALEPVACFPLLSVAWKHIYIFWIGQLVHTPLPVSLAPGVWHWASSALMAQPLVVITGHCFCPTDPPSTGRSPFCLSPSTSPMLIAQFNTRTSERINKTRQALPVFYMASERWIHAFVIMINAAVYYFYCRSGLNIAMLSYLSAVKIRGKKVVSVLGRWYRRPLRIWNSFLPGQIQSFKGEFQKFVRLYSRLT